VISHSLIIAVLESYAMAAKQVRWLAKILPANWELILVDDGSEPPIMPPEDRPENFLLIRTGQVRKRGEWTQHLAINQAAPFARGRYIVKSDIDHVFTPAAIAAADAFAGDMMLFHRRAGLLTESFEFQVIDHAVISPADDIYAIRRDLFLSLGGYPEYLTRRYGGGGCFLWEYSKRPEAQPPEGALIYVTPDTHEQYHNLPRVPEAQPLEVCA
jgi:hypothetical protein